MADLGDDGGLLYDLSRPVWNFRLEYTIGDTDDAIDGLLDADSALTDTATAFITITIEAGSVIPVAEANKGLAAIEGDTTPLALNIAAPTDNEPLPTDAITILSLPTAGTITVGAGGRVLDIGDTISVADLTSLVWNASGLAAGNYGSFSYSVVDSDGNLAADRNIGTPEQEAQIVSLFVAQEVINLGNFTNGFTVNPLSTSSNNGILNSSLPVGTNGADFGAALAVDTSGTTFGSIGGSSTRDLVIGAPGPCPTMARCSVSI
ncbi:hypothetical protein E6W36_04370 [Hankyongella ginsenosidimutans]|uniref:Uncharacterized protein n=1 Tax=Hankyongella ginsenosidimutans TaxID=1763828 RepID=A0A4D7BU41_9SPHN|nr:hypothetical protein [Hankyongella ginsenosidimutans]QCI79089.1 hypothetical protein E6W36_04370 [Hankyongella ginsenosidimutans]